MNFDPTRTNGSEANAAPGQREGVTPKLDVKDLRFYYGGSEALKGVNMAIHPLEVTAIIGPSGCGKSTLLRTFNRIYELHPGCRATGEVRLDGRNVLDPEYDVAGLRHKVGMVFQKPTPFTRSIYENIAFPLRHHERLTRSQMDDRVQQALEQAALWHEVKDVLRKSALALSGGQQQRLCIARAVALQPEVILLDEPTSALDPIATLKIEELLDVLVRSFTIVIVTHNLHQAARIADRTAFMFRGELVEYGPTEELFQAPKDKRTGDYITGRFG